MDPTKHPLNVRILRQILIVADDIVQFFVAITLLACAVIILARTIPNLFHANTTGIINVLNDVLLTLIIMELLWPVVRFLKRKPFILSPFLYIGIISCTRRILILEAEHSLVVKVSGHTQPWSEIWPVLVELGVSAGIILVLAIALRVISTAGTHESATDPS